MSARQDETRRNAPEREDLQKVMTRWGKLPVPVVPSEVLEQRRARGAVTLRAAIGSAGRERQTRRTRIVSTFAAALALALWGGFELFSPGAALDLRASAQHGSPLPGTPSTLLEPALVRSPGEVARYRGDWMPVQAGHTIGEGDRVRASKHSVDVRLDRITSVRVAPGSVLAITTLQARLQELQLESGTAAFEVDPERAAEVVVNTANARVRVTGTAFSVTSGGTSAESWSEVLVQRGQVEVASGGEAFVLRPGQSWSSRDSKSDETSGVQADQTHASPNARGERAEATTSPKPTAAGGVHADAEATAGAVEAEGLPTTLSEENRMFRRALSARNAGNGGRCVSLLSEFLTQFPSSPLRQEAVVAQFRCLVLSGDGARAHRAAARYLSEYPSGFAREEARSLVVGSAP